ncbi:hypothetical protein BDW75DRAFT_228657 [Aspergillus navahoensis]
MPVDKVRELHGLQDLPVVTRYYIRIGDEPLTEEQKEHNRISRRTAKLSVEFNKIRMKPCCLLDDKVFVAESVQYVASNVAGIKAQTTRPKLERVETRQGSPLSEKTDILNIRLRDASLGYQTDIETLQMLNSCIPDLFYRAFKCGSHGRHSVELGFRSSNQPLTPVYHDGTLLNSLLVNKGSLTNQCEGNQPSDLIALSDSPSRVLRIIRAWDYSDKEGDMIAVINVSKLLAMQVLFDRTTTLAEKLGMRLWDRQWRTGLQYANFNYWVAYRWIPAECIECYIDRRFSL